MMVCRIIIAAFVVWQVILGEWCHVGTHGQILTHCGATYYIIRPCRQRLYATVLALFVSLKDEQRKCADSLLPQAAPFLS